ncbi:MAG: CoA pyrophosphatase [Candidatus Aminicenantaceae bacterium]
MSSEEFVQALVSRLREKRPGLRAQLRLAPDPRPGTQAYPDVPSSSLPAGVLVLLYPRRSKLRVLLTRRTADLLHHQAQISFPGGQQEPGEDLQLTAAREAQEEVGIDPQDFRILGRLTPLFIPPSNYCIYPTLAYAYERPEFRPNEKEVAEVLEVPFEHLADPANFKQEMWKHRGRDVCVPFFSYRGHKIWGATAMVLAELMEIIEDLPLTGVRAKPGEGDFA